MEEEEVDVVGFDPCVFPSHHIITYCDTSEALRSAVTQTGINWATCFPHGQRIREYLLCMDGI